MRVLIVEFQGRGGIWHYAQALCVALGKIGLSPALATIRGHEPLLDMQIPVFVCDGDSGFGGSRSVGRMASHLARVTGLLKAIDAFHPQVLHMQGPLGVLDFAYFRLFRARGLRIVYTAHNPRPRKGNVGLIHRSRYAATNAVVVLSERGWEELLEDGVSREKLWYVPHGNYLHFVPKLLPTKAEARVALGVPPDGRYILFFGGIARYKGLDLLIESFGKVRQAEPDSRLIIAGRPDQGFAQYREQIERLGLGDCVYTCPQYVPLGDLPLYFQAADLVAFPYRRSYQSGALQLAYAFARPVVATESCDLGRDVALDGTGRVAAPDPEVFARALINLLSAPKEAVAMGARARHLAETKYGWEGIAGSHVKLYEQTVRLARQPTFRDPNRPPKAR